LLSSSSICCVSRLSERLTPFRFYANSLGAGSFQPSVLWSSHHCVRPHVSGLRVTVFGQKHVTCVSSPIAFTRTFCQIASRFHFLACCNITFVHRASVVSAASNPQPGGPGPCTSVPL
jgi:hypothetical protein